MVTISSGEVRAPCWETVSACCAPLRPSSLLAPPWSSRRLPAVKHGFALRAMSHRDGIPLSYGSGLWRIWLSLVRINMASIVGNALFPIRKVKEILVGGAFRA